MALLIAIVAMFVIHSYFYVPIIGLRVRLLRPQVRTVSGPGIQPLRIHVTWDKGGKHPIVSMNSKPIRWDDFGSVLRTQLKQRPPDWPVYIEGDPGIE
jgi:hypothetical protein